MQPQILVIRTGAIGDTIVMSVVYQALRRRFPQAYIEVLGSVERLQLINTPGLINKITSSDFSGMAALFLEDAEFPELLRTYCQRFDVILCYSFDPRRIITNNLCKIGAPQVYRFDPFPPKDADRHVTAYLLKTLEVLGLDEQQIFPEIALPENDQLVFHAEERRIAIHPGSGSADKNWAAANFAELGRRLITTAPAKIVLLAGPAEAESMQRITPTLSANSWRLLQNQPFSTIVAELRRCRVYIGNDSGMSHLAAAVGIPTIAIFGPSNPQVWRPIGKQVIVLQGDSRPHCVGVSVEQVCAAAKQFLG